VAVGLGGDIVLTREAAGPHRPPFSYLGFQPIDRCWGFCVGVGLLFALYAFYDFSHTHRMRRNRGSRLAFLYISIFFVGCLFVFTKFIPGWGQWYSPSPYYREQVAAFLKGNLALSHNPSDLAFDLSWAQGGVQQMWGLGIPLWQLPFDLVARLLGYPAFPDRIAFGILMVLSGYMACLAFFEADGRPSEDIFGRTLAGCGSVLMVLASPPLVIIMTAVGNIYHDAVMYLYTYAIILGCSLIMLWRFPSKKRYWLICGLAGLGGHIRPTAEFYGIATVLTASVLMLVADMPGQQENAPSAALKPVIWRSLVPGVAIFCLGGFTLWSTHKARFGNGFTFGYQFVVQGNDLLGNLYALRFDYPFIHEPVIPAVRELVGSLFFSHQITSASYYQPDLFPGQSPTVRFRDFLFLTYDASYIPPILAGWVTGFFAARTWWKNRLLNMQPPPMEAVVAIWSFLAFILLAWFYLWTPTTASRYLIDFAPAFAFAIIVQMRAIFQYLMLAGPKLRWAQVTVLLVLLFWIAVEISRIHPSSSSQSISWRTVQQQQRTTHPPVPHIPIPMSYKAGEDSPRKTGIPYNGVGWNWKTGALGVCAIFFVDGPNQVELRVSAAPGSHAGKQEAEDIRVRVGLEILQRRLIKETPDGWRILFNPPQGTASNSGVQQLSIAGVANAHLAAAAGATPWILNELTWRR
jgi:hypothetical protein